MRDRRLRSPARLAIVLSALALAGCAGGRATGSASSDRDAAATRSAASPAARIGFPAARRGSMFTIGHSVEHRPIRVGVLGGGALSHAVLVVGCIHGDERAGIAVARWLIRHRRTSEPPLWVLPDLNPDGAAAGTRQNAHRVDLNRNFPFGWRPLFRPGDQQYQGPRPLSEPESRAAAQLIVRLRPRVTVWFHQPQGLVDLSGGDPRIERRLAAMVGLPVRKLLRYPGSAPTWQNHVFPADTAFVVELPPGPLGRRAVTRFGRAVLALARAVTG